MKAKQFVWERRGFSSRAQVGEAQSFHQRSEPSLESIAFLARTSHSGVRAKIWIRCYGPRVGWIWRLWTRINLRKRKMTLREKIVLIRWQPMLSHSGTPEKSLGPKPQRRARNTWRWPNSNEQL